MSTLSRARGFGKRVYADFSEKNVTFMAAGIAYNAFVSLAPMLLLLLLVVSTFGGGLEARVVAVAGNWLPGPIANVVEEIFRGNSSAAGASVVGLVVLLWGTLKIFRGLDTAFSEIYETRGRNSFVDQLKDGIVVLVALVVAIVSTIGVTVAFSRFSDSIPFVGLLTPLVLVAGLVIAFYPMYYRFPDTEVGLDDVLPGVVFAAVGWAVLQGVFQVYLLFKDPGSGSFFGSVILVVTYLYFSGLVLLLGAVINAVVGGHSSGEPGGVGRAATSYDTQREETLDREELADYLADLRNELAGRYDGMRPATHSDDEDRRPRPAGDVQLTEHQTVDGDERRWTVTLQWTVAEESEAVEASERPADD
ncbi:YihY/virulence factor BrkB family protein [Halorussus sp. MSC15.2]|uniref:YihY/virulence factor BrkB family protein n=1 Tax=Halorussus sp. MSC15.2 TaxID=2283638 RepID=UPI0013D8AEC6|nr:YihY/virulence factor BrkB family protein [Halorussus sp. MSC15.2]NEU55707.1 YihY/virulence factor BrkB family protein [Halorussus sp. MSC15.2]